MSNDLNSKQGRSTHSNREFRKPPNPQIDTNQFAQSPNVWDQVDWSKRTPDTASKWAQGGWTPETYEYRGPTLPNPSGNPTQTAFTGATTPNTARRQVHDDAQRAAKGFEDDDIWVPTQPAPRTPAPHAPYTPPTDPQGSQSQYPYQNQYQGTSGPSAVRSQVPVSGQGSMQPGGDYDTQGEDLVWNTYNTDTLQVGMPLNRSARQRVPEAMLGLEALINPTIGTADTGVMIRDAEPQP